MTATLRVGPYVLVNDYRNPAMVARESATLDLLSGGRFELGIGAGRPGADADYAQLGIPFDSPSVRVERLAESLAIIKSTLSGETLDAAGPHYTGRSILAFPRAVQQPRPPILVAGGHRRILSLAAREADIVAFGVGPDETEADILRRIGWMRAAAEDRVDDLEFGVNLLAIGSRMPSYARAFLKLEPERLAQTGSPLSLSGDIDAMCAQLLARRERLGVSDFVVSDELMDAAAPLVERLAGR